MKRIIYGITLSLALLFMGNCTREHGVGVYEEGEVLMLFAPTRSVSYPQSAEDNIETLRLIIFKSNSLGTEGELILNTTIPVPAPGNDTIKDVKVMVPVGYLNIYLIANESADMNLSTATTLADIRAARVDYSIAAANNHLTPSFPMFSEYKAVRVNVDGDIISTHNGITKVGGITYVDVVRVVAKLTVTMDCNFSDLLGSWAIALDSARLVSMPLKPWLSTNIKYIGSSTDFFDSEWDDISSHVVDKYTGVNITGFEIINGFVFYLPEHIVDPANSGRYTYLEIRGHLVARPDAMIVYTIPICEGLGLTVGSTEYTIKYLKEHHDLVPSGYLSIVRNTHYKLHLRVKSYGDEDVLQPIEFDMKITDWEHVVNVPLGN